MSFLKAKSFQVIVKEKISGLLRSANVNLLKTGRFPYLLKPLGIIIQQSFDSSPPQSHLVSSIYFNVMHPVIAQSKGKYKDLRKSGLLEFHVLYGNTGCGVSKEGYKIRKVFG